jgi:hypothetical protein
MKRRSTEKSSVRRLAYAHADPAPLEFRPDDVDMLEIHVAPGHWGREEHWPIKVPINAFTTLHDVKEVVRANDPERTGAAYMEGVPLLFHIPGVPAKDVTMQDLREAAARHRHISFSYDTDYVWNAAFAARAAASTTANGGKTARRRVRSVHRRLQSVRHRRSVRRRFQSVRRRRSVRGRRSSVRGRRSVRRRRG